MGFYLVPSSGIYSSAIFVFVASILQDAGLWLFLLLLICPLVDEAGLRGSCWLPEGRTGLCPLLGEAGLVPPLGRAISRVVFSDQLWV